ncbi:C-type lectin lectoxin-Thr1 [Strongylocentrotus purpuratus]|uniref:C-type lectin domain-containing protein n=1 Tax=Strongylocentrotus purpuratus TaxID=7668 RepID=A0A7M7PAZ1_STRPU|nr:C-type lectin lectoxin-Thr1 [Strongylocentrotus purpuratus]
MASNFTISLLLLASIACLAKGCCPEKFMQVGDRCYHFSSYKKTWSDANRECEDLGAHLVSLHSSAESEDVYNLWKSFTDVSYADDGNRAYWIGLNDREYEGSFKWSDGTSVDYYHWQSGEPNNDRGEDCVSPRNYGSSDYDRQKWNDYDCDENKSFFCYKPFTS